LKFEIVTPQDFLARWQILSCIVVTFSPPTVDHAGPNGRAPPY
jgi:hypothetical protein